MPYLLVWQDNPHIENLCVLEAIETDVTVDYLALWLEWERPILHEWGPN